MITEIDGKKLDFHQLIEHSLNPFIIIDKSTIKYANQACKTLVKVDSREEILNQSFKKFLHPDYHDISDERLKQVLTYKKDLEPVEIKIIDAYGQSIDVESKVGVFYFGTETMAQVILQDISDRKETDRVLMHSEKLSVIGELAAGIVHEIRNPLTIVKGFLELLDGEVSERGEEYVKVMLTEVKRIESIANELLYFSKPHEHQLHPHNLVPILENVNRLLENTASKKQVSLNLDANHKEIVINCDQDQIKQVFINIIKNAIEATPANGRVNITLTANSGAAVSISDTGCGLSKEQLNKLGTSFMTTKENGTGLGLMVSYNIIKNHKGEINVDSVEGEGTTFVIELPKEEN
ncbi:ATP-binding protein [Halobacillus salinarum]|uniref:histidine kinase n=1 Tax=Halobacillus salinarum TaxID=2932257 RepID=A0ABY4EQN9_9BACI|nr:ATP-binding protein [Halobacillus salinarum]UOQ45959.1 ATP-binding protein [Halobacillus salinarum]